MKLVTLYSYSLFSFLMAGKSLAQAQAQVFEITQPTSSHWWVAGSDNTIAWKAKDNSVPEFSVFLSTSDKTIIPDKLALISSQPNYEYSKTFNPGEMKPAKGYQLEFTDRLNSSNVYAVSESFEIKSKGSSYPPQNTPSASSSASSSGSSTPSSSSSAASVSASSSNDGKTKHITFIYGGPIAAATSAMDFLIDAFKELEGTPSPYSNMRVRR